MSALFILQRHLSNGRNLICVIFGKLYLYAFKRVNDARLHNLILPGTFHKQTGYSIITIVEKLFIVDVVVLLNALKWSIF